jgi:hypothetical protein
MTTPERDRYVTFDGLNCDSNATLLIAAIHRHISTPGKAGRWGDYFTTKFTEQQRLGVDDLFFIGSQMNNLFEFFAACEDPEALALLYQVEQECC